MKTSNRSWPLVSRPSRRKRSDIDNFCPFDLMGSASDTDISSRSAIDWPLNFTVSVSWL